MSQSSEMSGKAEFDSSVTTCANCGTPMPLGLRFCRNCGFRLGEGPAEYTETVRFPNGQPGVGTTQQPFSPNYAAPLANAPSSAFTKPRKRMSGMSWMFIGLLVFFLAAAAFTAIITPIRRNVASISVPEKPRAFIGVNDFETGEGGVTFNNVEPPGSPADKAGLVGGDIITSFDGHVVTTDDEMTELMGNTPIGKAVDVIYLRDGEQKMTKLTPITRADFERLEREFANRAGGKGRFGFDDDDTERVPIPGTKMFGVRLDDISQNLPADMAGIKEGDIVVEFDGVPIRTPEELSARVRRAVPYNTIKVVVMRGAEMLEIPVKMGRQ
ncbi:MAG TPA: PDZ domain-containing protein [Pyrinomonadaceae bacterium]|nr:PDZ domain-containing protein [Pyrinomonadaceae bacterium]